VKDLKDKLHKEKEEEINELREKFNNIDKRVS
jgi:hypothetical protein